MAQQQVSITENAPVSADCFRMTLRCPDVAVAVEPGQFVMLRLPDAPALLLPRPFSICSSVFDSDDNRIGIELLYKVVGAGTRKMAALTAGDRVSLVGPLGKGFCLAPSYKRIFLVAGGIGVAPLVFLAQQIHQSKNDRASTGLVSDQVETTVFLGGATQADLLCREDFAALDLPVQVATEDGSAGVTGLVTTPLVAAVSETLPDVIFACGPNGMLEAVMALARKHEIACQLSIETMMSCGIGACLGCAVKTDNTANKYLHACKDGPVFNAEKIRLS